jgi:Tol biopolymer transport system component
MKKTIALLLMFLSVGTSVSAQTQTCDDVILLDKFTVVDNDEGLVTLYWYDLSDKSATPAVSIVTPVGGRDTVGISQIIWSRDRTHVIYSVDNVVFHGDEMRGVGNLYALDCFSTNPILLTGELPPAIAFSPVWSPDESQVAYTVMYQPYDYGTNHFGIEIVNADGTGRQVRYEIHTNLNPYSVYWSDDGIMIVRDEMLYLLEDNALTPLLELSDRLCCVSPDGTRAVVAESNENSESNVFLLDLQNLKLSLLVADLKYLNSVAWSPDSTQLALFFEGYSPTTLRNKPLVNIVNTDGSVKTTVLEPIGDTNYPNYLMSWTPDGKALVLYLDYNYVLLNITGEQEQILLPAPET